MEKEFQLGINQLQRLGHASVPIKLIERQCQREALTNLDLTVSKKNTPGSIAVARYSVRIFLNANPIRQAKHKNLLAANGSMSPANYETYREVA